MSLSSSLVWREQFEGPEPPEYTPEYSPSVDPPLYDQQLHSGEQRLLLNGGGRFRFLHSGVLSKASKKKDIVLNLYDQQAGATEPVYGKNGRIEGTVALKYKASEISKVVIKVEGLLKVSESDWITESVSLVDFKTTLWTRTSNSGTRALPSEMPFHFRLPSYCIMNNDDLPVTLNLPPTYSVSNASVTGFHASVEYRIAIEVDMMKGLLSKRNSLVTPFIYFPRSHPPYPTLVPPATFLSTLKVSPEEWSHSSSVLKARYNNIKPIEVNVILPKGSIYPLSTALPFHVQLQGSPKSLNLFTKSVSGAKISAMLFRKAGVEVAGRESWNRAVVGQAKLSLVMPAAMDDSLPSQSDKTNTTLAWDGHVQPDTEEAVGTFRAGKLYVKDFFVVTLTPDDPTKSPFAMHQHFVPICLVSDHFDAMGMGEVPVGAW